MSGFTSPAERKPSYSLARAMLRAYDIETGYDEKYDKISYEIKNLAGISAKAKKRGFKSVEENALKLLDEMTVEKARLIERRRAFYDKLKSLGIIPSKGRRSPTIDIGLHISDADNINIRTLNKSMNLGINFEANDNINIGTLNKSMNLGINFEANDNINILEDDAPLPEEEQKEEQKEAPKPLPAPKPSPEPVQSRKVFPKVCAMRQPEEEEALIDDPEIASLLAKPLVTKQLVTKPLVTRPLLTKPLVTKPLVTKPLLTKPLVTKPLVTKPLVTKPLVTKPLVTKPLLTKPLLTKPLVTKPSVTKPLLARPVLARPVVARPVLARPVLARPVLARPVPSAVKLGQIKRPLVK